VSLGDQVEATVLGVDLERRRISLSLDEGKGGDLLVVTPEPKSAAVEAPTKTLGSFGELLRESMNKTR
jgi:small subunit ribosomal protein S1